MEKMRENNLAPIVVFVYKRPEHTQKVIEALLRNEEAADSELIVFADGAKSEADWEAVNQVREIVDSITGFRQVIKHYSPRNKGLANSVMDGVTLVMKQYGRAIIVEDDLIVSPYFLRYMNEGLTKYESEKRVFGIGGYIEYSEKMKDFPDSFFLNNGTCWTWATWEDRWVFFDKECTGWEKLKHNRKLRYKFDYNGTIGRSKMMMQNRMGLIDSWAIRFDWARFINEGIFLFPKRQLASNIGFDGSGTHCGVSEDLTEEVLQVPITYYPNDISVVKSLEKTYIRVLKDKNARYVWSRMIFYFSNPIAFIRKFIEKVLGVL